MQTIDQHIAHAAHEAASKDQFANDDFRNAIKKAATRVRVSGIGVTVAFCLGKGEKHQEVAEAWCKALKALGESGCGNPKELIDTYRTADFARVRRLTERSERVLEWMAKWADAYKPEKAGKD